MILGDDLKGFLILADPSTGSFFAIRKRLVDGIQAWDLAHVEDSQKLPPILMHCARALNAEDIAGTA